MATLKSGVLMKLLADIKDGENIMEDDRKPVLLQIRSIIPVLEEGDLWPIRGFYLKVSDMSHAIYVSLPPEENDMVSSNKLKLGQFIYVQNLEKAEPVPLVRGVIPIPGRRPCEGSPEDIDCPAVLLTHLEISDAESIVEKGVIAEKKIIENSSDSRKLSRGLSDSSAMIRRIDGLEQQRPRGRIRSSSASKIRPSQKKVGLRKSRPSSVCDDSDSDSTLSSISSSSSQISKRKSWTESEIMGLKEMFHSSVNKHDTRPVPRSRSATASPVRSVRYDSSDDNSSSTTQRRDISSTKKLVRGSTKNKTPLPSLISQHPPRPVFSTANDRKGAESAISWGSLPPRLEKLGKELVRQRDSALNAAAVTLQEACAAERLLNSLSTYSDFHLAEGDDLESDVDKFFDLQDDLVHNKLIMQSLTNISPLKTSETDTCGTVSVKEALKIAIERNKNAASWLKCAVALDLSPCSTASLNPTATQMAETHPVKKSSSSSRSTRPKGASLIKKHRTNDDTLLMLTSGNNQVEWTRGSTLSAATDLANSLQDECRKLFLCYVEKYLAEVERKTSSKELDGQITEMMYKVKRVSDWLDLVIGKEPNLAGDGSKGVANLDDSEIEAYGRVRNKIYGILLNNVGKTARL